MPAQPLMEDVESSWRLRELGGFVHLGCNCRVSSSKWQLENCGNGSVSPTPDDALSHGPDEGGGSCRGAEQAIVR